MNRFVFISRLILAINSLIVSHEVLDQWTMAYLSQNNNSAWLVTWRFDLLYPHEPWINVVFLLFTMFLSIVVLVTLNRK